MADSTAKATPRIRAAANPTQTEETAPEAAPETANVGTATNPPSASETLPEGTPVDPTSGPQGAPSPLAEGGRTGYHCGYCGESIGAEGQHYHPGGEVRATPHAGTMVVADEWAQDRAPVVGPAENEEERQANSQDAKDNAKGDEAK